MPRRVVLPAFPLLMLALTTVPATAQDECTELVREAWLAVEANYFDPGFGGVDWAAAQDPALAACASGASPHAVIRSMLRVLNAPAVRWVDAERAAALPNEFAGAPSAGIGLIELLSIDIDERTRLLTVVTPMPGSPAARAGLRPGDIIESIDGIRSDTMTLADAVDRLRGEPGTVVTVGIRREGTAKAIPITRAAIEAEPAVEHHIVQAFSAPWGYLRLNRFRPGAGAAVAAAVDTLERAGARGIILDLRDNPGGLVNELVAVAEVFLPRRTTIATIAGRPGNRTVLATSDPARTGLPIAVLIDRGTASAAEALAEALQAARRAVVIGNSHTFRKGLAHSIQPLSDGSAVMVPVGRLISPSARDILYEGVEPAIRVQSDAWPVLDPDIEVAGPRDTAFQRAVIEISGR